MARLLGLRSRALLSDVTAARAAVRSTPCPRFTAVRSNSVRCQGRPSLSFALPAGEPHHSSRINYAGGTRYRHAVLKSMVLRANTVAQ